MDPRVRRICNGANTGPQFVAVTRIRISSIEFFDKAVMAKEWESRLEYLHTLLLEGINHANRLPFILPHRLVAEKSQSIGHQLPGASQLTADRFRLHQRLDDTEGVQLPSKLRDIAVKSSSAN